MAKTQTFGDKVKKGSATSSGISVKVIKWFKDDSRNGSVRSLERLVKISDPGELDKLDLHK